MGIALLVQLAQRRLGALPTMRAEEVEPDDLGEPPLALGDFGAGRWPSVAQVAGGLCQLGIVRVERRLEQAATTGIALTPNHLTVSHHLPAPPPQHRQTEP